MEFQTKLVQGNKNPKARMAWVGRALVFLGMVLMCIDGYQRYGFWVFGVGLALVIFGAIQAKGNVDMMVVSDIDLVISSEEIRIGETTYRISQVTGLEFQVEEYD